MLIVGLGGLSKDPACAVLANGKVTAAIEEKKLRRYAAAGLPSTAIAECLKTTGAAHSDVDCVAVVRPLGPETELHLAVRELFPKARVVLVEHHTAHAASAFFASGFPSATVLTLDRGGDFRCGALWEASGNQLNARRELFYPDSIGDVYGRVTELLGFQPGAEEHKVQWLSASGDDRFVSLFERILCCDSDGWPRIGRDWLRDDGFGARFYEELGVDDGAALPPSLDAHVASGIQRAVERTVLRMAGSGGNLCLAGGVFFNALLVAALERSANWDQVFVQPASGNSGTALGAVLYAFHVASGQQGNTSLDSLFLGPEYGAESVKQVLENCKLRFRYLSTTGEMIDTAVAELNDHKIVAWMQGRMEFGPRALGNRSILASPLDPYSTENLNTFIKHRESFRKFAASIPAEVASEYFETGANSRFLATVGRVRPEHRKTFESAVLGDGWVRVHTVEERDNPLYYRLLQAAGKATGLPVLYNTSFNLFSDPLVCTPRDAVRSFYSSGIDSMFIGNFVLRK